MSGFYLLLLFLSAYSCAASTHSNQLITSAHADQYIESLITNSLMNVITEYIYDNKIVLNYNHIVKARHLTLLNKEFIKVNKTYGLPPQPKATIPYLIFVNKSFYNDFFLKKLLPSVSEQKAILNDTWLNFAKALFASRIAFKNVSFNDGCFTALYKNSPKQLKKYTQVLEQIIKTQQVASNSELSVFFKFFESARYNSRRPELELPIDDLADIIGIFNKGPVFGQQLHALSLFYQMNMHPIALNVCWAANGLEAKYVNLVYNYLIENPSITQVHESFTTKSNMHHLIISLGGRVKEIFDIDGAIHKQEIVYLLYLSYFDKKFFNEIIFLIERLQKVLVENNLYHLPIFSRLLFIHSQAQADEKNRLIFKEVFDYIFLSDPNIFYLKALHLRTIVDYFIENPTAWHTVTPYLTDFLIFFENYLSKLPSSFRYMGHNNYEAFFITKLLAMISITPFCLKILNERKIFENTALEQIANHVNSLTQTEKMHFFRTFEKVHPFFCKFNSSRATMPEFFLKFCTYAHFFPKIFIAIIAVYALTKITILALLSINRTFS